MKSAKSSRTIAVNILTLVVAAAAAVAGTDVIKEYPQYAAILTAAIAGVNIVLRFLTTQPIKL